MMSSSQGTPRSTYVTAPASEATTPMNTAAIVDPLRGLPTNSSMSVPGDNGDVNPLPDSTMERQLPSATRPPMEEVPKPKKRAALTNLSSIPFSVQKKQMREKRFSADPASEPDEPAEPRPLKRPAVLALDTSKGVETKETGIKDHDTPQERPRKRVKLTTLCSTPFSAQKDTGQTGSLAAETGNEARNDGTDKPPAMTLPVSISGRSRLVPSAEKSTPLLGELIPSTMFKPPALSTPITNTPKSDTPAKEKNIASLKPTLRKRTDLVADGLGQRTSFLAKPTRSEERADAHVDKVPGSPSATATPQESVHVRTFVPVRGDPALLTGDVEMKEIPASLRTRRDSPQSMGPEELSGDETGMKDDDEVLPSYKPQATLSVSASAPAPRENIVMSEAHQVQHDPLTSKTSQSPVSSVGWRPSVVTTFLQSTVPEVTRSTIGLPSTIQTWEDFITQAYRDGLTENQFNELISSSTGEILKIRQPEHRPGMLSPQAIAQNYGRRLREAMQRYARSRPARDTAEVNVDEVSLVGDKSIALTEAEDVAVDKTAGTVAEVEEVSDHTEEVETSGANHRDPIMETPSPEDQENHVAHMTADGKPADPNSPSPPVTATITHEIPGSPDAQRQRGDLRYKHGEVQVVMGLGYGIDGSTPHRKRPWPGILISEGLCPDFVKRHKPTGERSEDMVPVMAFPLAAHEFYWTRLSMVWQFSKEIALGGFHEGTRMKEFQIAVAAALSPPSFEQFTKVIRHTKDLVRPIHVPVLTEFGDIFPDVGQGGVRIKGFADPKLARGPMWHELASSPALSIRKIPEVVEENKLRRFFERAGKVEYIAPGAMDKRTRRPVDWQVTFAHTAIAIAAQYVVRRMTLAGERLSTAAVDVNEALLKPSNVLRVTRLPPTTGLPASMETKLKAHFSQAGSVRDMTLSTYKNAAGSILPSNWGFVVFANTFAAKNAWNTGTLRLFERAFLKFSFANENDYRKLVNAEYERRRNAGISVAEPPAAVALTDESTQQPGLLFVPRGPAAGSSAQNHAPSNSRGGPGSPSRWKKHVPHRRNWGPASRR
ncbi:hypothetical protein SAICODRAFT_73178 [Saitoella complicata NRRL Y-17804]|uniref:uncharacterized protein n=1 Tax=Saitoella complicata (strain BCRC 22490 / CBS 7301 / JCM 7358 / NBRC 10748 / NRRL Y-17804) TaxID=698492 RepID=UPI000866893B|nr:uncharacterized protein SAICODRAFT_73178 [Saitoella complicata NRRL Y-17804]ODQ50671.1 hypothetical protein SAICODRAFT_73178 [Saitoella complicata NRRL Y-17804]